MPGAGRPEGLPVLLQNLQQQLSGYGRAGLPAAGQGEEGKEEARIERAPAWSGAGDPAPQRGGLFSVPEIRDREETADTIYIACACARFRACREY